MSLPHALLTALIERPSAGLELAKRFDRSIGYFWPATHQQIYRELAKLEEAGFVQAKLVSGARGGKKEYQVLPAGREELEHWATASQPTMLPRDELLVRLRAAAVVNATTLVEELEALAMRHRQKLTLYHQIEARDFSSSNQSREQKLRHLVLKTGIDFENWRIKLCEDAAALLRSTES